MTNTYLPSPPGAYRLLAAGDLYSVPVIGWTIPEGGVTALPVVPAIYAHMIRDTQDYALIEASGLTIDLATGNAYETEVKWDDALTPERQAKVDAMRAEIASFSSARTTPPVRDVETDDSAGLHGIRFSAKKTFKKESNWTFDGEEGAFLFVVPPGEPAPDDSRCQKQTQVDAKRFEKDGWAKKDYAVVRGFSTSAAAPATNDEPDTDDSYEDVI